MKISILCPTRERPEQFADMVKSAKMLAARPDDIEILARVDLDDAYLRQYASTIQLYTGAQVYAGAPILNLVAMVNELAGHAIGDLIMAGNDDMRFRTQGWDDRLRQEAAKYPDGIFLAHFHDGSPTAKELATFPIVSSTWKRTLGTIQPPQFARFFADTWMTDVARALGRLVPIMDVLCEHLHPAFGKAAADDTFKRWRSGPALAIHGRDEAVYRDSAPNLSYAVEKLRAAITLAAAA